MYDVLVCGAGPAGATIATLLANSGMKVAVVDPLTRPTERLELIAPSATELFEVVGLGHLLRNAEIARYCSGIRRDWGGEVSVDEFLAQRSGAGYVIDRCRLDGALRGGSRKAGACLLLGRVVAIERERSTFCVRIRHGEVAELLLARIVVDASGRAAALARRLGARRVLHETLLARRTRVSAADTQGRLLVKGHSAGWDYRLAGSGGRCETWEVFSKVDLGGDKKTVVDASSVLCAPSAGPGWAAIGDAAASFDPLCSQGLANALSTALAIAGAIVSISGLGASASRAYSEAVRRTFENSERGRRLCYAMLGTPERRSALWRSVIREPAHAFDCAAIASSDRQEGIDRRSQRGAPDQNTCIP